MQTANHTEQRTGFLHRLVSGRALPAGAAALVASAAALGLGLGAGPQLGAGNAAVAQPEGAPVFEVDPVHSMIVFRIKHLGIAFNYGMIHLPEGSFNIDVENPDQSFIDMTAKIANIDTGNESRDNHLKASDFFDARRNPTLTFKSESFTRVDDDTLEATGTLSFAGESREIIIEVDKTGEGDTRQGYKQGFETTFTIKRSEWGMDTYVENGGLGDEVTLMVSAEGARK